ncbi:MAG: hypothetical protein JNM66_13915 [Bryobacterales bacterium]|nr:hypothetical protein [Bryobacterales bacterium]
MKFSFKSLMMMAAVASLPALAVPTARLRVTDLTSNVVLLDILDNSALDTDSAIDGLISLGTTTTAGGNWKLRFTGASSKPDSGTSLYPELSLQSSIELLTSAPRKLRIEFSEIDFDGTPFEGLLGTTTNASANGSVKYGASYDTGNASFGGNNNYLTLLSTNVVSGQTYSDTRLGSSLALTPFYSLTITSEAWFDTKGRLDIDANLSAVPEPGFYGALAIGLSGLFAVVARRRKSSNV